MNKYIKNFFALGLVCSFVISFGLPQTAVAGANLNVVFADGAPPDPMFSEANFLPGDAVIKWAKVTNKTSANQSIVAKLTNYSDPDSMGLQFEVVIKKHGAAENIYTGSMTGLSGLSELVLNSSLAPNVEEQYDFSVTFKPEAGNPYQEKVLSFDFVIALQGADEGGCEGSDCGGGEVVIYGGGGGSSGGGGGSSGGSDIPVVPNAGGNNPPGQVLGDNTNLSFPSSENPGQVLGATTLPNTGLPPGLWLVVLFFTLSLIFIPWKRVNN